MRVTNSMISNSAKTHISKAKNSVLKYADQYTTGTKIQRPSDDPSVAVRSLKLRNTYSQITQYAEKNIKDAINWMDTTQSALDNVASKLSDMKYFLNQGANDYLEADDRASALSALQQYVKSIFQEESNTDYAGRYVFTGYRTDTSLLFPTSTDKLTYQITENFEYTDFDHVSVVTGGAEFATGKDGQDYVDEAAKTKQIYKMHLAYNNLSNTKFPKTDADGNAVTGATDKEINIVLNYDGAPAGGEVITPAKICKSTDAGAYDFDKDEVVYLYDTGEILVGDEVYEKIEETKAEITVDYVKTEFDKFDIRPEMYFKCIAQNTVSGKITNYSDPDGQEIRYEVNYSQTLNVNTQAKDAISTDIYRVMDYIAQTVSEADEIERKIADIDKMISGEKDDAKLADLKSLKETLEMEKGLRGTVMTEAFGMGLTMVDKALEKLNIASAELGAKYKRAELTENKLMDEQTNTEDKLSNNEDVDIADVIISLSQSEQLYQASLSATAKILGNSLLNYI